MANVATVSTVTDTRLSNRSDLLFDTTVPQPTNGLFMWLTDVLHGFGTLYGPEHSRLKIIYLVNVLNKIAMRFCSHFVTFFVYHIIQLI